MKSPRKIYIDHQKRTWRICVLFISSISFLRIRFQIGREFYSNKFLPRDTCSDIFYWRGCPILQFYSNILTNEFLRYSFSPILTFIPNIIWDHLSCQLGVNSILNVSRQKVSIPVKTSRKQSVRDDWFWSSFLLRRPGPANVCFA